MATGPTRIKRICCGAYYFRINLDFLTCRHRNRSVQIYQPRVRLMRDHLTVNQSHVYNLCLRTQSDCNNIENAVFPIVPLDFGSMLPPKCFWEAYSTVKGPIL